jgi:hypothetical protein
MATTDAVAAVGLTLQSLLADRIANPTNNGTPLPVTLGPPGPERDPDGAVDDPRINLFLYQVVENCYLKNQEIPGHGHAGAYGYPPLSLDLHYLLTVFGSTASGAFFDETPAHQLLGASMQVLHDNSIVSEAVVTRRPPAGRLILDPALRDEYESIKVTVRPLGLEDLSNVWTALELSYRLSVAYEVSVVQIDSARERRHPRPVQEPPLAGPRVYAVPLQRPNLTSIGVRRPTDPPASERSVPYARIGDTVVLHGDRFSAGLFVSVGRLLMPATVASGGVIEVVLPDDTLPDGTPINPVDRLNPGASTVSIASVVPDLPQAAVTSAGLPIVVVPAVSGLSVTNRTLTVTGNRLMDGASPSHLIVGDSVMERASYLAGSTDTSVKVALPGSLPIFPAVARVSGALVPFPAMPAAFDLNVRIGGGPQHVVTLTSTPTSLPEAASALQEAIRSATDAAGFAGVQVTAADPSMILVAGDRTSTIEVAAGALANALKLAAGSASRNVYLSGALRPFPRLTSGAPQVRARLGATTADVALGSVPRSLDEAASLLEAGLRSASAVGAFTNARVATLGDQLCIVPGTAAGVVLGPVPGVDETTVAELELARAYLVRAAVRGVESIDEETLELP